LALNYKYLYIPFFLHFLVIHLFYYKLKVYIGRNIDSLIYQYYFIIYYRHNFHNYYFYRRSMAKKVISFEICLAFLNVRIRCFNDNNSILSLFSYFTFTFLFITSYLNLKSYYFFFLDLIILNLFLSLLQD
jgi:hypothetical protein